MGRECYLPTMGSDPLEPTSFGRPEGTVDPPEGFVPAELEEYPEAPLGEE